MKKFSNITNAKIGKKEEVNQANINEEDSFRFALMGLIDKYLHIQTYGPIDRYLRAGTMKITGKEALAEALVELMTDKSTNEKTALLESLKGKVRDWEAIDEKIEQVEREYADKNADLRLDHHKDRVLSLVEKYGDDEDFLIEMVVKSAGKIKSQEGALMMAAAAASLQQAKISEIYAERANQLAGNE